MKIPFKNLAKTARTIMVKSLFLVKNMSGQNLFRKKIDPIKSSILAKNGTELFLVNARATEQTQDALKDRMSNRKLTNPPTSKYT